MQIVRPLANREVLFELNAIFWAKNFGFIIFLLVVLLQSTTWEYNPYREDNIINNVVLTDAVHGRLISAECVPSPAECRVMHIRQIPAVSRVFSRINYILDWQDVKETNKHGQVITT